MVICLDRGADLHMVQLMPLPLTVSCFSKIQICFTFLVLAHLGSPGKRAVKRVCVCVCYYSVGASFCSWHCTSFVVHMTLENCTLSAGIFCFSVVSLFLKFQPILK